MKDNKLVSVIVLCYRRFDEIFSTLGSIFIQSYPEIELIISDDGSDNWYDVSERIGDYVNRNRTNNIKKVLIKHFDENVGTSRHVNNALKLCNGEYIKLLPPGDEFYDENVISEAIRILENEKTRILVGQTYLKRKNPPFILDDVKENILYRWKSRSGRMCNLSPPTKDILYMKSLSSQKANMIISSRCFISTISVFFKKELLDETNGFPTQYRLIEDVPFWPQLALNNEKFSFGNLVMIKYALDGISNSYDGDSEFSKDLREIVEEKYIPNEYRGIVIRALRKCELRYYKGEIGAKSLIGMLYVIQKKFKYLFFGSKL